MKRMRARKQCVWRQQRKPVLYDGDPSRERDDGDENNDRNDNAFSIKAGLAREQRVMDILARFVDPHESLLFLLLLFSSSLLLLSFSLFSFFFFNKLHWSMNTLIIA